ncbi:MAG: ABC transporter permease [Vicinamibacteria bacterium]|nr:ABC transporter permease [Vicinamibacteria bacterium]
MSLSATLRSLVRARGLCLGVSLTLALGVAALTATFAVTNAALFRRPPFPEADRLFMLNLERRPQGEPERLERWSFARFQLLRRSQKSFEDVASHAPGPLTLSGDGNAELVEAERVSASYFPLLRARASLGRVLAEAEDAAQHPAPVAVLGHRLWERRFASEGAIIGRTIRLNGVPLTVIGVMPPGFAGLSGRAEVWVPATLTPELTYAEYLTTNQNFISAFGRLKDGVRPASAQAELATLGAVINRALPSDPAAPLEPVTAKGTTLNEARSDRTVRRSLLVLLGAVGVLHLLACANVINLLLGRAASRRRDSAVRLALGSSNGRLFKDVAEEGLLLALPGGLLGVGLAAWACAALAPPTNAWAARNFYGSLAPFDAPGFGPVEAAAGLGLTLMTALLVAVLPALGSFRMDVSSGIQSGSRSIAGGGLSLRRPSTRGIIVAFEAALAMLLVVGAGLLIESFQRMRGAGLGVEQTNVLTFWIVPSEARVPPAAAPAFVTRVLDALTEVPGVLSATVDGGGPVSGTARSLLYIEGRPAPLPGQEPRVLRHYIGPDHFRTLEIPIRRGRVFTPLDTETAPRVAVISETAARRFWPGEDPIGRRVWFSGGGNFNSQETSAEIVGVVADVIYEPLDRQPNRASFYTPYTQFTYASRMVFLRTTGDPRSTLPDIRKAMASVDPEMALRDVRPLTEVVSGSWARHRFDALLFGAFGVGALLLAASGVFAVLSHAVQSRTREFGVRMALGADSARLLRQVVREGMAFPAAGLFVGAAAALGLTRLLQSALYEISPQEPRVFGATVILLLAASAAASIVPAWRATRTDPIEALRAE